ncbi:MAG: hypothetical protein J2P18_04800 [Nocardia sp.]|nr:hypothetical protein [Nocardia sp.]
MSRELPFGEADGGYTGDAAYHVATSFARVARAGAYVTGGALIASNGAPAPQNAASHSPYTPDPHAEMPSPVATYPDLAVQSASSDSPVAPANPAPAQAMSAGDVGPIPDQGPVGAYATEIDGQPGEFAPAGMDAYPTAPLPVHDLGLSTGPLPEVGGQPPTQPQDGSAGEGSGDAGHGVSGVAPVGFDGIGGAAPGLAALAEDTTAVAAGHDWATGTTTSEAAARGASSHPHSAGAGSQSGGTTLGNQLDDYARGVAGNLFRPPATAIQPVSGVDAPASVMTVAPAVSALAVPPPAVAVTPVASALPVSAVTPPAMHSVVAATPLQTTIQPEAATHPIANVFTPPPGPSPLTAPAHAVPALFALHPQPGGIDIGVPNIAPGSNPANVVHVPINTQLPSIPAHGIGAVPTLPTPNPPPGPPPAGDALGHLIPNVTPPRWGLGPVPGPGGSNPAPGRTGPHAPHGSEPDRTGAQAPHAPGLQLPTVPGHTWTPPNQVPFTPNHQHDTNPGSGHSGVPTHPAPVEPPNVIKPPVFDHLPGVNPPQAHPVAAHEPSPWAEVDHGTSAWSGLSETPGLSGGLHQAVVADIHHPMPDHPVIDHHFVL